MAAPAPSDAELEILKLFWRQSPMSAREVQDLAEPQTGWALSTTRTVLERMRAKGLLRRHAVHGVAVYAPVQDKVDVVGALLRRVRGLLDIDGALPASAFSGSQILSAADLDELQALINRDDGGEGEA